MKKVAIIMGSDSDLPVVEKGISVLKEYGVPFEVHVYSAHRTPEEAAQFSKSARENGFGVIIAAAGMAAHLAGAIAANTTLPVIGIPCSSKVLEGMDALLSTIMMPPGIPVATVGVNTAKNAALLAIEMLAIEDAALAWGRMPPSRRSLTAERSVGAKSHIVTITRRQYRRHAHKRTLFHDHRRRNYISIHLKGNLWEKLMTSVAYLACTRRQPSHLQD